MVADRTLLCHPERLFIHRDHDPWGLFAVSLHVSSDMSRTGFLIATAAFIQLFPENIQCAKHCALRGRGTRSVMGGLVLLGIL